MSNVKTINCNENGHYSIYESDRYGFNNDDKIWDKEIDYLVLGDSMVLGNCVNTNHIISSQLMDITQKILNLGMAGNGPLLNLPH